MSGWVQRPGNLGHEGLNVLSEACNIEALRIVIIEAVSGMQALAVSMSLLAWRHSVEVLIDSLFPHHPDLNSPVSYGHSTMNRPLSVLTQRFVNDPCRRLSPDS